MPTPIRILLALAALGLSGQAFLGCTDDTDGDGTPLCGPISDLPCDGDSSSEGSEGAEGSEGGAGIETPGEDATGNPTTDGSVDEGDAGVPEDDAGVDGGADD